MDGEGAKRDNAARRLRGLNGMLRLDGMRLRPNSFS